MCGKTSTLHDFGSMARQLNNQLRIDRLAGPEGAQPRHDDGRVVIGFAWSRCYFLAKALVG